MTQKVMKALEVTRTMNIYFKFSTSYEDCTAEYVNIETEQYEDYEYIF